MQNKWSVKLRMMQWMYSNSMSQMSNWSEKITSHCTYTQTQKFFIKRRKGKNTILRVRQKAVLLLT